MSLLGSFFGTKQVTSDGSSSATDAVTYVASLASDPRAIDPILDKLREVTARLQPGEALNEADQKTLVRIYKELADYLATKDPLRSIDANTLNQKVNQKFPKHSQSESTFWSGLQS